MYAFQSISVPIFLMLFTYTFLFLSLLLDSQPWTPHFKIWSVRELCWLVLPSAPLPCLSIPVPSCATKYDVPVLTCLYGCIVAFRHFSYSVNSFTWFLVPHKQRLVLWVAVPIYFTYFWTFIYFKRQLSKIFSIMVHKVYSSFFIYSLIKKNCS